MIRPTLSLTSILALCAGSAVAQDMNFNRIASFMVAANTPDAEETSAEIISATEDGMTLVYSDSPAGVIGFIDITDPANPVAAGVFAMPEGEPTAVAVHGMTAYAGEKHVGKLCRALRRAARHRRAITGGVWRPAIWAGQPDSIAVSPDGGFVAVAIENERDEDLGDGRVPQLPQASWPSCPPPRAAWTVTG